MCAREGFWNHLLFLKSISIQTGNAAFFLKNYFKKKKVLVFIKVQYINILNYLLVDYKRL